MQYTENKNIPGLMMLIDSEKAFDSVSWKFLYKTLEFYGFSETFIQWIKLFNNDIGTYVLQSGFLSKRIPIRRGCRQGDPISAYLFLIAAEVMALMIKFNKDIKGIRIESHEFKLTQFADDITLFLNGSTASLQAALNTLEIFGNFSGLKMNKEKTKMIWIGRKKFSKEKLQTPHKLNWGDTIFSILGLEFSVDIPKIPELNFNKTYRSIMTEIKKWECRNLSIIGKVTVIKTFLLSKLVHLLTSLPVSEGFLKNINDCFFKFLWSRKPDKIKRSTTCLDYMSGGRKMIDIFSFEKALKVNWIKRILFQQETEWKILLSLTHDGLNSIFSSRR